MLLVQAQTYASLLSCALEPVERFSKVAAVEKAELVLSFGRAPSLGRFGVGFDGGGGIGTEAEVSRL